MLILAPDGHAPPVSIGFAVLVRCLPLPASAVFALLLPVRSTNRLRSLRFLTPRTLVHPVPEEHRHLHPVT
jgi:hypothetical protein